MAALSINPCKIEKKNLENLKKAKQNINHIYSQCGLNKATFKANVADVDSIQVIHTETTLTK